MIRLLIIFVILIAAMIFAPELSAHKGYLLISFDSYTTYETTIVSAIIVITIFYFLLLLAEWCLRRLFSLSRYTRGWFGQRKTLKAQKNSRLGMLALLEGDTKQAQKLLSKSAPRTEAPALTYISAARASHKNGDFEQRDDYLQRASEHPGCKLAVGLVWAELQLDARQYENALATLNELEEEFPKNKQVLQYCLDTYSAINEWEKLINLLHTQRKSLTFSDQEFNALELKAHQQLFQKLAMEDGKLLDDYWHNETPRWMRKELTYQKAVINAYIDNGRGELAKTFLLDKLHRQLSLPLLPYLQKVELEDTSELIAFLEKQLKKSQYVDYVHQALAYLKLKENQPEAVVSHLTESVKSLPNVNDYNLLASLLEEQGDSEQANVYYREGLQFAVQ
ncbi:heme biosynthesis HemY N-terminal domain-containing protein [Psychromonas aquatilis]|uniref:Heme biosynthesis HemY N-terminal domain-containing protein n=1 Tax=Psychromonas aquatilis TaxID=2005072 RepID=A0ABU9GQD5_9GAMM